MKTQWNFLEWMQHGMNSILSSQLSLMSMSCQLLPGVKQLNGWYVQCEAWFIHLSSGSSWMWKEQSTIVYVRYGNHIFVMSGCRGDDWDVVIAGELTKLRGEIKMNGRVAYVPQQAWIQNLSVRDNITFGKPFDRRYYDKVRILRS